MLLTKTRRLDTNNSSRRRLAWGIVLTGLLAAIAGPRALAQPKAADEPTTPAFREGAWMDVHKSYLDRAQKGEIDLLFLGDSITMGWGGDSKTWERFYGPRRAANFGIGGDGTQHVLWRLDHGEIDGIAPKVVVVMIGTNNLYTSTPAEIADGVSAIVAKLREKLPKSKVLLLGVFPRAELPNDPIRARVEALNARMSRLADGKSVNYLDIGRQFKEPGGTISKDVMPDFLHLTRLGYRVWADAMEPTLWNMMEGNNGPH